MNFQKISLFTVIFFIGQALFAQTAPGYLGKKLIISYNAKISPALFNPNKNGEKGVGSFMYKNKVSIDYVRTRKKLIGIAYEMYATGLDHQFQLNSRIPNNSETFLFEDRGGGGILNVKGISIYRMKFKKGIAPLGKYNILGVKFLFASTDLSDANFVANNSFGSFRLNVEDQEATYFKVGFVCGSGVNRVIGDKIVLKLGVSATILPFDIINAFSTVTNDNIFSGNITDENDREELFGKQAVKRLFGSEILSFTIAIGFLAY